MSEEVLSRDRVEAAIDRYETLGEKEFRKEFPGFSVAREYWVRSSRQDRRMVPFPTKPIAALALTRSPADATKHDLRPITGGWSGSKCAASLLHNAGFIIVGKDNKPVHVPDEPHLIKIADRIRSCALNYYIAPERESGQAVPVYTYRPHTDGYAPKKLSIIELYADTIAAHGPQNGGATVSGGTSRRMAAAGNRTPAVAKLAQQDRQIPGRARQFGGRAGTQARIAVCIDPGRHAA